MALFFILIQFFLPEKLLLELLGFGNLSAYFKILSCTDLKIIVNYNVFLTGGEYFAQLINFASNKKTQPDSDLKFKIDWRKIKAVFLLTNLFYCWFWPFTYTIWLKSIPPYMIGLADQPFTGLISISLAFLTYSLVEKFWPKDNEPLKKQTLRQIIQGKSLEFVQTLRWAFPCWVIALGGIFGLPSIGISISFSTKNALVSFCEIPFAIFMFCMAYKESAKTHKLQIKPWVKYATLAVLAYSTAFFAVNWYFTFSKHVAPCILTVLGSLLYSSILYFGFKKQKITTTGNDLYPAAPSSETAVPWNFPTHPNTVYQTSPEEQQKVILEPITASDNDIENALTLTDKLIPASFQKDEIYELRYNKIRFDEYSLKAGLEPRVKNSPEALLQAYVDLLRTKAPDPKRITIIPCCNENIPLLALSRYVSKDSKIPIGEGSINIEGNLDGQLLRIVGMLNIVFAVSHIPIDISADEMSEYNCLIDFIEKQYKRITGKAISLGNAPNFTRHIIIPQAQTLPTSSLEEYYRLTIQQLNTAA
ncbi:MAG: hypothetical protein ABH844_04130 [Candidatus Omnitrophota bacterium]